MTPNSPSDPEPKLYVNISSSSFGTNSLSFDLTSGGKGGKIPPFGVSFPFGLLPFVVFYHFYLTMRLQEPLSFSFDISFIESKSSDSYPNSSLNHTSTCWRFNNYH